MLHYAWRNKRGQGRRNKIKKWQQITVGRSNGAFSPTRLPLFFHGPFKKCFPQDNGKLWLWTVYPLDVHIIDNITSRITYLVRTPCISNHRYCFYSRENLFHFFYKSFCHHLHIFLWVFSCAHFSQICWKLVRLVLDPTGVHLWAIRKIECVMVC